MLIAVLGSQGVGKTTLLNALTMIDYSVDAFKVSRTVQKELGYTSLTEAVETFNKMKEFQETIIERKFEHDLRLSQMSTGKDVVFVERSFYDILAYAELWIAKLGYPNSTWLDGIHQACVEYQKRVYDGLILIEPNSHIRFEHDPERADEKTQRQIDQRLKELCSYSSVPLLSIKDFDLQYRVDQVVRFIGKL